MQCYFLNLFKHHFGIEILKLGIKNLIWYVLNKNKSHIYTLKYYGFHIHVHLFQKVDHEVIFFL